MNGKISKRLRRLANGLPDMYRTSDKFLSGKRKLNRVEYLKKLYKDGGMELVESFVNKYKKEGVGEQGL